ncbi:MAG: Trk system potassium transporter TrkA [Clostridia bacterium]|nr:Trk system potassium transporter TrkA [Clostridia bacterium]
MNIIIVGCSQVGETLASQLVLEDNNITMIDLSSSKIKDITSRYDVMGVVGNGATRKTQVEAGIDDADLLIALTDSDELNLLCCMIAKKTTKCRVIARVVSPEYNSETSYLKDELGLEMIINPELESAEEIARILRFPSAIKIEPFAAGKAELVTFRLPETSRMVGMWLKDVISHLKVNVLISTVERDGNAFIPNGNFIFKSRDVISIVASPKNAYDFFKKIDCNIQAVKDILVVGGGDITHYLCEMVGKSISVKVIEKDLEICDELCTAFKNVTVINGDAADQELLLEEGIASCGAFLALNANDEENILLSLSAKNETKAKTITKINRADYDNIVSHLDLDTVIYPKSITSDMILRYVRATKNTLGSNVETMYNVIKGKVEASEFKVNEGSPITAAPLAQLRFKKDVLVAAILRDGAVIIPRGSDRIVEGDSVVIVSKLLALRDIADILD